MWVLAFLASSSYLRFPLRSGGGLSSGYSTQLLLKPPIIFVALKLTGSFYEAFGLILGGSHSIRQLLGLLRSNCGLSVTGLHIMIPLPATLPERGINPRFSISATSNLDLLRKSGEFPMSYQELDDTAATIYEGI
jgi:hypothetical protein